jgi:flavin-dependent dehydrogenase
MTTYDALIIGAGIAGLTAGAYLAKGGARVWSPALGQSNHEGHHADTR